MREIIYEIKENSRIKEFLKEKKYPSKIISAIKRTTNGIMLNDQYVFVNEPLKAGDILKIKIENEKTSEKIPSKFMEFEILYEDHDVLVINKPAGIASHPSLNHFATSISSGVKFYLDDNDFVYRCINRLDKDTSGAMIIAKNRLSAGILASDVKEKRIKRTYYAVVRGDFQDKTGTINAPIARTSDSIIEREVNLEKGEVAITHYEQIMFKNQYSLVKLQLETGRTHQIRVHLKHINRPIIGDFLYNPDYELINRQALHSVKIEFTQPITNEFLSIEANIPKDIKNIFK